MPGCMFLSCSWMVGAMDYDIAVVGGGLAGLALCAALRRSRLSVALIEGRRPEASRRDEDDWDARIYAVSPSSQRFLADIGAWSHLDPARLQSVARMEVFGDGNGALTFSAFETGVPELAWIVEQGLMADELWQSVKRQGNVDLIIPARPAGMSNEGAFTCVQLDDGRTLRARLVVGADGARSWVRAQIGSEPLVADYEELGCVANFRCELPHQGIAWQWFRPDGVLAWLPLPGRRMSMVWSAPHEQARQLLAMNAEELSNHVAEAGSHRLGQLQALAPAAGFPLRLMRVPRIIAPGVALVGDAAHAIHPLSGHGINLGFQDVKVLAQVLQQADPAYLGDLRVLRRYERERAEEVFALQWSTHALRRLFQPRWAPLSWLRNTGLNLTQRTPVLREALIRYALG